MFITIEGGEGSGKSTLQARLVDALQGLDVEVIATREPGGSPLSEAIRSLLLDPTYAVGADAETLLFLAARAEHIEKVIRPALSAGKWVICDRFNESTIAYQGYGRQLGAMRIASLCDWVCGGLKPDLVLWIDIDPEKGLERARGVTEGEDRLENEAIGFHRRVRDGFVDLASRSDWMVRLDGELSRDELAREALCCIEDRLL